MRSLNAHLIESESHERLPFHPDCPICQTRLAGSLLRGGFVSVRVQAAIATGLIAASTVAPSAAVAVEQDQEREGTAPAAQAEGGNPAGDTAFDPGGGATALPEAPPSGLPTAASPEVPAPSGTSNGNPTEAIVDEGDGTGPAAGEVASPPATTGPPVTVEAAPPVVTTPPPSPATPPQPVNDAAPAASEPTAADATGPSRAPGNRPTEHRTRRVASAPVAPVPAPTSVPVASPTSATPSVPAAPRSPAEPGDTSHIVEPGESLWAIAADLLGDDATPARIAREVHRLWQLNGDRIGTGDPDLLMIGTELSLR